MTAPARPTEDDYFRYDDASNAAMQALARTSRPLTRSRYLTALGDHDWHRASLHTALFGEDPDEDGVPQAEWLADSARLLWIVAEAEYYRGRRGPHDYTGGHFDERARELRAAAKPTLFAWMRIGPPTTRRPLLRELVQTWLPLTRGQAVESIACIPFPRWAR